MLEVGNEAPFFSLPDEEGVLHDLKEYSGRNLVLYFYPKDMTPGCTDEACQFRDEFPKFLGANAAIVGISADSPESHMKFKEKYGLQFTLLSDSSKETMASYGAWKEITRCGHTSMGCERTTVIIDAAGKLLKIFPKVRVKGHSEEVIKFLGGR